MKNAITPKSLSPDSHKDTKQKRKRKHRTNPNSTASYKQVKQDGTIERETEKVMRILTDHQPATSRRISQVTGVERSSICRTLYDLIGCGKIKVAFDAKCPQTNKTVGWYSFPDWSTENEQSVNVG